MASTLWTMRSDGTEHRQMGETVPGELSTPGGWSPDASRFVFTRGAPSLPDREGHVKNTGAIYAMSADGTGLTRLAGRSSDPDWSPDGRHIAFASDRDQNGTLSYGDRAFFANELYVMRSDGSGERRLTRTRDVNERKPDWSPDGSLIAYQVGEVVDNAQGTSVFVVAADGECTRRVADDPLLTTWFANPTWRPGSKTDAPAC